MSKTPKKGRRQGYLLDCFEGGDEYRRPFVRALIATNDPCSGLSARRTASVHVDRPYASRTGQGIIGVSRSLFASLGRVGSGLPASSKVRAVYSRAGGTKKHHYPKDHLRGKKGEAMAFRRTVVACKREPTLPIVRPPSLRNMEGKKA
jgi:hypothetical protein